MCKASSAEFCKHSTTTVVKEGMPDRFKGLIQQLDERKDKRSS